MAGLFISYRRDDAAADVDRLVNDLSWRCRRDRVFTDRDIPAGADFRQVLVKKIETCDVVLVVMGPHWLDVKSPDTGKRRLDEEHDYVRMEVALALEQDKLVIPVRIAGAPFPRAEELPEPIRDLAHKNALDLGRSRRAADLNALVEQFPPSIGVRRDVTGEQAAGWTSVFLVPIALLVSVHLLAMFAVSDWLVDRLPGWVPVDARVFSLVLALVLGARHAFQFRSLFADRLRIGSVIAIGAAVLDSILVPLLGRADVVPRSAVEFIAFTLLFVGILGAYLVGAELVALWLAQGFDRREGR
jgi:TIR domain